MPANLVVVLVPMLVSSVGLCNVDSVHVRSDAPAILHGRQKTGEALVKGVLACSSSLLI
jgi:hypothetical protein